MSAPAKPHRRGNSLVRKLTFREVWRVFSLFFGVNVVICMLFVAGVFMTCVYQVGTALEEPDVLEMFSSGVVVPSGYPQVAPAAFPANAGRIVGPLARAIGLPGGTLYEIYSSALVYYGDSLYGVRTYAPDIWISLYAPTDDAGHYLRFSFDMSRPVQLFMLLMSMLCIYELWALFLSIFKARRAIERILQPIYDLTLTAQSISAEPALEVSGAIDTLNMITALDLDKRISIEDERTELQGLAGAINGMLDRLDAAYQSQLRFVSDASHELRTPIAVIQGYAGLLDRWGKEDPKALQESIDAIKSEAASMQALVEQLLFLARTENRSITISPEKVDISALVAEVLREAQMIDNAHVYRGDIEPDLFAFGDLQLLKQALRIFADNSRKYTSDGGIITLGIKSDGNDTMRLWVSDTGIGIGGEDLPHIFERFYRSDSSRARKTGGTGLGLSIAKWIIDSHGGHVEIVSRQNIGTRMTIVMRRMRDSENQTVTQA